MLKQQLINENKYGVKCPYIMSPRGICIHNTANDAPAKNEISYMQSNNNEVSFHIAIDDVEAIQGLLLNRNAWHAGDGGSGEGNRNYIAIEICYSKSGGDRFIKAEERAAKEVAALLKQYGWGLDKVKKHQDFSNKYCPHRTLDMGWQRFLDMVRVELNGATAVPPTTPSKPSTSEYEVNRYAENGKCTICVREGVYFYNKPCISEATGSYEYKESVNYDLVVITNKYVYISWISASTGVRRYMPVLDKLNNERWGNCI